MTQQLLEEESQSDLTGAGIPLPSTPAHNQPDTLPATSKSFAGRTLAARAADREIDRIVYELYGLVEEEIAVVEGLI